MRIKMRLFESTENNQYSFEGTVAAEELCVINQR